MIGSDGDLDSPPVETERVVDSGLGICPMVRSKRVSFKPCIGFRGEPRTLRAGAGVGVVLCGVSGIPDPRSGDGRSDRELENTTEF